LLTHALLWNGACLQEWGSTASDLLPALQQALAGAGAAAAAASDQPGAA
jgi:hypothetical protein